MTGTQRDHEPDLEQSVFTDGDDPTTRLLQPSSPASLQGGSPRPVQKMERPLLGLALYGISSLFLATVLMCSKLLSELPAALCSVSQL